MSKKRRLVSDKFPEVDGSFPLIVPSFRKLVKLLAECAEGGVALDCTLTEYQECDAALGVYLDNFMNAMRLKELPAEPTGAVGRILVIFSQLGQTMSKLREAIKGNQVHVASEAAFVVRDLLFDLEKANDVLRQAESEKPRYSEVPVVNCLLSAGQAILDGWGEWESLARRLEVLIPKWNEMLTEEPIPPEMARHDVALDQMVRAVNDQDTALLSEAMQEIKISGELLGNAKESIAAQEDGQQCLCPRCCKLVGEWDRSCPSCGCRLPERLGEQGSLGDCGTQDMPGYVKRVFELGQTLDEHGDLEAFTGAVAEVKRRAVNCRKQIDKLPIGEVELSLDEQEAIDAASELIDSSLEQINRAVDMLGMIQIPVDQLHLQAAQDVLVGGVEEMRRASAIFQRYIQ